MQRAAGRGLRIREDLSMIEYENRALYVSDDLRYEEAKGNLCLRVVNAEHNCRALKDLPHVKMEDLAAVFYHMESPCGDARVHPGRFAGPDELLFFDRLTDPETDGAAETAAVRDPSGFAAEDPRLSPPQERLICWQDLNRWGISTDVLLRDASASSIRMHPAFFAPLRQILGLPAQAESGEIPMYVLSCIDARFGASVLLYPHVIPTVADRLGDDIYIIPSSVHELLILRAGDVEDPQGLIEIIREVNRTEVSPGEILSDSLYAYERGSGGFTRLTVSGQT